MLSPWLLLISTAISLFLGNQADLGHSLALLRPFGAWCFGLVGLGCLLLALCRYRLGRLALWAYYLVGPVFVVWSVLRGVLSGDVQEIVLLGGFGLVVAVALQRLRNVDPRRSSRFWAAFGVLVVAVDLILLTAGYSRPSPPPPSETQALARAAGSRPNIYHLLFDGYQADLFPHTLTPDLSERLRGLHVFPETTTSSGRTRLSIPSVFAGRAWDPATAPDGFIAEAMNSEVSLLHTLSQAGYQTTGYLHSRFGFAPNLFDQVLYHQSFYGHRMVRERLAESDAFKVLWIHRYMPRLVARRLLGVALIERIEAGRLAPKAYATGSFATFEHFLAREEQLGDSGRYTFVHLLLPHEPYVLDSECTLRRRTTPVEQFRCATLMIADFVDRLRELGRFEPSLILIHADHGLDLVSGGQGNGAADGRWQSVPFDPVGVAWNHPRSKALLLYKPPGRDSGEPLRQSAVATSLLDLAPTVLRDLDLAPAAHHAGLPIDPNRDLDEARRRYYHYYTRDRSDEVFRFVIEGDRFELDGNVESR